MEKIIDILNFKNPDMALKIKERFAKKSMQFVDLKKKQKLEQWALALYDMGINPNYKDYDICIVCADFFGRIFKYIYAKNKKKIFFLASKEGKNKKNIIDSFKYTYSSMSKSKFLNNDLMLRVGFVDFNKIKNKIKNSNNFKNESYIDILNNILVNDVFFIYVDSAYIELDKNRNIFYLLMDEFVKEDKNLIVVFDSDSSYITNFIKEVRAKNGREKLCFTKLY